MWEEIEREASAARDGLLPHVDTAAANEFQAGVRENVQRLRDMKSD